ncbi:branched-chain alpha-keto acid dehydrogenase subunit E2 [Rhodococcus sp. 05-2256-B2]|uniref:dihydrolipoamide acetyltransferase family protein n=1 Tax=unclassified Rhodococcus (in: high G+C Gram-positive bacteria) TaxID=192944 RepID=UPI00047F919E|nr:MULTISPECIES: dihydrolipoamide acetyltransferase family protein [unclassified Rhodococcus (in: high G+C Gram-positive bacteria)]OZD84359.1 branched-chain alpha-keto acid dehydrogenase subunit E2 [Rhodococcus sp. 05-2256-B4]OZD89051.1 branched-chain alpha-keto acid dehydrogenase subunit E2 [Rhodococcus sp. 05-2256-B3]OZD93376.1 branched-chain alpha-keto acid dehydrogenase subunit E2 [Rhodococcus sp. 05-2256-B2]OZE03535.1 branched-chain alpha-keto acid dehydrogenase subunit E2 [Rhodococcus sp.
MSMQVFLLPDLGEGLTEAEIVEWKVKPGDTVTIDQVVVEVETAKASVEVPCPFEGVVGELHAAEGTSLAVGAPLISITGGAVADTPAAHERYREEERAGSGNVLIGYGTGHGPTGRRKRASHVSGNSTQATNFHSHAPKVLSPIVRSMALQGGLDLASIETAGGHGVITRADVERALAGSADASSPEGVTRIPITGIRKTIADKLSRSRTEIPEATVWVDVDATAVLQARRDLDASVDGVKVTLLAVLAKLTMIALSKFPELNSTVDTAAGEILRYENVGLGIAAQTDRGLMVPVVPQADKADLKELSERLAELTELARTGSLPAARLSGGTFTLNNYGVFGVDGSAAIINHPEAAILGIGRIIDRPWVVDGQLAVRKVAQLSLAFDHRVCDGGVAGGFLRTVADFVENPVVALGSVR